MIALVLAGVLSGCGPLRGTAEISPASFRDPLVESMPLAVGVHYSPEFKARHVDWADALFGTHKHTFRIGAASQDAFDRSLKAMFDTVVPVKEIGQRSAGTALAGTIVPEISSLNLTWPIGGPAVAALTYEVTLYDSSGARVETWTVGGRKEFVAIWIYNFPELADVAFGGVMRTAIADFLVEFEHNPAVRMWIESIRGRAQDRGSESNTAN